MQLTILAASGRTGRELTRQALERGHTVTALARHPERLDLPDTPRLRRVVADVRDPASMARALDGAAVVLSGLGVAGGDRPGALTEGARAVVAAAPGRIIWLGALGTGESARVGGALVRAMFGMMREKTADKVAADTAVLGAGGTVFHAGPLGEGPVDADRRTVGLDAVPRRSFPARIGRATVAAAMLDEAEDPRFPGTIAIPLNR